MAKRKKANRLAAQAQQEINSSCIPKEPFIRLGSGTAPSLNYNLPQASCFSVAVRAPLGIPKDAFKKECKAEPENHFWTRTVNLGEMQIRQDLQDQLKGVGGPPMINGYDTRTPHIPSPLAKKPATKGSIIDRKQTGGTGGSIIKIKQGGDNDPIDEVIEQVQRGRRPMSVKNFWGERTIRYLPKPVTPEPTIYLVLKYSVCSYLGDYGAGKTVKTFSLLPGETTSITIRTFKQMEETRTKSENILDSVSAESSEEFENSFTDSMNSTNSNSSQTVSDWNVDAELDFKIPIPAMPIQTNISGGYSQNKTLASLSEMVENSIENTLDRTVASSSSVREVTVNETSTQSSLNETENLITRQLENINKSRVLNFVFRQLLQEYITITYLKDVQIVYSNGFPESYQSVGLDGIDDLLAAVIDDPATAETIQQQIILQLCNLFDYTGTRRSFVEKVEDFMVDCDGAQVAPVIYYRKRKDLKDVYQSGDFSIEVPGMIKSVSSRIIRTDSVVVDALLGQGEALDCYNQRLQDAAATMADLENDELAQKITIIEGITDPIQRAELYKRVFGDCCEVAQTQIIS